MEGGMLLGPVLLFNCKAKIRSKHYSLVIGCRHSSVETGVEIGEQWYTYITSDGEAIEDSATK